MDKEVLDSVLVPTEIARPVPYLLLPKWEEFTEILQEEIWGFNPRLKAKKSETSNRGINQAFKSGSK